MEEEFLNQPSVVNTGFRKLMGFLSIYIAAVGVSSCRSEAAQLHSFEVIVKVAVHLLCQVVS